MESQIIISCVVGWIATILGIVGVIPVTISVYKKKDTTSISLWMYIIYCVGCFVWIIWSAIAFATTYHAYFLAGENYSSSTQSAALWASVPPLLLNVVAFASGLFILWNKVYNLNGAKRKKISEREFANLRVEKIRQQQALRAKKKKRNIHANIQDGESAMDVHDLKPIIHINWFLTGWRIIAASFGRTNRKIYSFFKDFKYNLQNWKYNRFLIKEARTNLNTDDHVQVMEADTLKGNQESIREISVNKVSRKRESWRYNGRFIRDFVKPATEERYIVLPNQIEKSTISQGEALDRKDIKPVAISTEISQRIALGKSSSMLINVVDNAINSNRKLVKNKVLEPEELSKSQLLKVKQADLPIKGKVASETSKGGK